MKLTHTYSGHDIMNNEKTPVSCFTSGKRLSCLFAFLFFFGFTAVAQVKNINKTTGTVPVPFQEIDSVWFDAAGGQMKVVKQNGTVQGHAFSEINNITFSANNYPVNAEHCNLPTVLSEVTNPLTGRTWMDRNLGASRVALSPNDSLAFGDLHQWGRRTDGHQCRNSPTTAVQSNSPQTSNNNFVLTNYPTTDWLSTPDNSLWQGNPGANNPCPSGFRLPTVSEMQQEQSSWTSNNMSGAFAGPLKWTLPGYRDFDGTFFDVNNGAYYWCSNTDSLDARYLFITPNTSTVLSSIRSLGYSVRCIKELPQAPATCGASGVHNPTLSYGSMYDQDSNAYKTIVIGTQEWMAENLKASHYRNGDAIPMVTDDGAWFNLGSGAYSFYNNDSVTFNCPYGKLYNWYAVGDARELCPNGWHVPTDAEWTTLGNFLGGDALAGGKTKSIGTQYWIDQNLAADNSSGFSGLPGGYRNSDASFVEFSTAGVWWSSSQNTTTDVWARYLYYGNAILSRTTAFWRYGYSVRCIRD